jgi:hypothetical protein
MLQKNKKWHKGLPALSQVIRRLTPPHYGRA